MSSTFRLRARGAAQLADWPEEYTTLDAKGWKALLLKLDSNAKKLTDGRLIEENLLQKCILALYEALHECVAVGACADVNVECIKTRERGNKAIARGLEALLETEALHHEDEWKEYFPVIFNPHDGDGEGDEEHDDEGTGEEDEGAGGEEEDEEHQPLKQRPHKRTTRVSTAKPPPKVVRARDRTPLQSKRLTVGCLLLC